MKILYVENHAVFAQQVCQQFLSAHRVRVVSTLASARQALADEQFDLLIADYDLDDGKGDEIVRMCRVLHPHMKIIASSSHDTGNAALMKAGASAVCGKMQFDSITGVIQSLQIHQED